MPECDTRLPKTALTDATSSIDAHVNKVIKDGRGKRLHGAALVDHVYDELGAPLTSDPRSEDVNKAGIEKWGETKLAKSMIFRPKVEETKFKGVTYRVWDNSAKGYDRVLSSTLEVTGKGGERVRIGVDKLGHFLQQGYEYWEMLARKGKSLDDAHQRGSDLEWGKYGLGEDFGADTPLPLGTGVYSWADLRANLQGYRFYRWLETSSPSATFRLRDYVSDEWNEESNVNCYNAIVAKQVWANLLSAMWSGFFIIDRDDKKKSIPCTCQLTAIGQKAKGKLKYTHNHGPKIIPFNGNISYIPWSYVGYRGIRMDIAWSSGEFNGRARLTSRHGATDTEDKLVGTWGWFDSHRNGGSLSLVRQ